MLRALLPTALALGASLLLSTPCTIAQGKPLFQEAKDEAEAADICYVNYGVTFTMLSPSPSPVTGKNANPVFRELNRLSEQPSWNFNKYVVSVDGKSVRHFDSEVTPGSATLAQAIEKVLN